ncbi:MAG TPA: hypothetical protein VI864_01675 [Candidatus Bathyarchaeia archaeon]|nr:hypothetical protein [Candidatus Bathyarchaeia archaeon]
MDRRKVIRILKFFIIGLVLLTIVLFGLGVYTLFSGLMGAVSSDTFGLDLDQSAPSGDWVLRLNASPRNNGILEERLFLSIGLLDANGEYIAVNSTSVNIAPGAQSPFSLTLTIPYATVQRYNLNATQGADVVFELLFGIRTLGDLVGFQQTMRIAGNATL